MERFYLGIMYPPPVQKAVKRIWITKVPLISTGRSQRSEVRGQRSEIRGQKETFLLFNFAIRISKFEILRYAPCSMPYAHAKIPSKVSPNTLLDQFTLTPFTVSCLKRDYVPTETPGGGPS